MKTVLAHWHGTPSLDEARRLREALAETLDCHQVPQASSFLLAVAELVVNLSRYPEPRPSKLSLCLSRDDYYWNLELLDNGPGFNAFSQQINQYENVEAAESGMGLKLLASQFYSVSYVPGCYREDGLNSMLLRQPLAQHLPEQKVLVVDDDAVWRAVIAGYLRPHYQLVLCESARLAFQQVLQEKPDVVICDLKMPENDGTVLFDWLSHIPEVAAIAFIYLSGCDDEVQKRQALKRPIDDFLYKPVQKADLLQVVQRVLSRRTHLREWIQRDVEQKITLGLHPSLPTMVAGFRCALRTLTPESGGGDLVLLRHETLMFADLMGHGVQAKGFAYALAGYLRGLCAASVSGQPDVAQLLQQLTRAFEDDPVLSETLATIVALTFTGERRVNIANAGQPHPILLRGCLPVVQNSADVVSGSEVQVEQLEIDGPLLGLGMDSYQTLSLQLKAGERLLLFSDGLLDASEPLTPAFVTQLQQLAHLPLEAAADALLQYKLADKVLADDMTFILLEWPCAEAI